MTRTVTQHGGRSPFPPIPNFLEWAINRHLALRIAEQSAEQNGAMK